MTPTDIKSWWWESWKSDPVVSSHLVDDPAIRQPGFTFPQQQWFVLNRLHTGQWHCGACRKTWRLTDTDLCPMMRPKRCPTSSNPALLPSWTVVCLSFTLLMLLLLPGWPIMGLKIRRIVTFCRILLCCMFPVVSRPWKAKHWQHFQHCMVERRYTSRWCLW